MSVTSMNLTNPIKNFSTNMANYKSLEIDSSIFENVNSDLISCCNNKYNNCIVINRLLTTLSYYLI